MTFRAVITAGGRVDGEFARAIGTTVKALAPFDGSTLLSRTIAAARGAGADCVAVVGGAEVRAACEGLADLLVEESSDGAENLSRALGAWDAGARLLYLTSDMPYVSAHALRSFMQRVPADALALPLSSWRDFDARFPGAPAFGITLAGERVVNGGAFVLPPHAAGVVEVFAKSLFQARKSPWQMARLTGIPLLVQFALGRLGVGDLERHAERLLRLPAIAVRDAAPELAYDVDVYEEYRYAIAHA